MVSERDSFGSTIRSLREEKGLALRQVSQQLKIDTSTLSKIERNERSANKEMIDKLANIFKVGRKTLWISFLSDKLVHEVVSDQYASEVIKVAGAKVRFLKQKESKSI